jgi:hypothetical protein
VLFLIALCSISNAGYLWNSVSWIKRDLSYNQMPRFDVTLITDIFEDLDQPDTLVYLTAGCVASHRPNHTLGIMAVNQNWDFPKEELNIPAVLIVENDQGKHIIDGYWHVFLDGWSIRFLREQEVREGWGTPLESEDIEAVARADEDLNRMLFSPSVEISGLLPTYGFYSSSVFGGRYTRLRHRCYRTSSSFRDY